MVLAYPHLARGRKQARERKTNWDASETPQQIRGLLILLVPSGTALGWPVNPRQLSVLKTLQAQSLRPSHPSQQGTESTGILTTLCF